MVKSLALVFCLGVSLLSARAVATEAVFHIQYTEEYDSLDEIAARFFPKVKERYNNQIAFYKKDLMRWNAHITNWKNLTSRRAIYIDTPNESETKHDALNRRWSLFLFYSAHYGNFSEKVLDQSTASAQTSPVALGLTSYYNIKDRKHAIVSNLYGAYLLGSKIDGNVSNANQNIDIPWELGVSVYYQYTPSYFFPTVYTGVDRETFTSFNTKELLQGESLETRDNVLYFYTLGMIQSFDIKNKSLTLRASYAKTFTSSNSSASTLNNFEGSRIHFNLSYKASSNMSYNLLYKRFDLTGPSDLVVNRFGIGLGYQFY
jgi:hypothetical protein